MKPFLLGPIFLADALAKISRKTFGVLKFDMRLWPVYQYLIDGQRRLLSKQNVFLSDVIELLLGKSKA